MALSSGCASLAWYGQAARGHLEITASREDIAELLADPDTPSERAEKLALVLQIRAFATEELALPDNRSYTVFADIGRDAVVWNVVAAPAYSLEAKTWCYFMVGCLAYRGYFRKDRAERLAAQLEQDGYDTLVAPVPAYSTLGRFADPVLNTMLEFEPAELAGLIFHELAHQRVFVKGETAFNEAYASLIEQEGTRRWLLARADPGEYRAWQERLERRQQLTTIQLEARAKLAELYQQPWSEAALEHAKRAEFEALDQRLREAAATLGVRRFGRWPQPGLNNADLALLANYQAGVHAFAALLAKYDGHFADFHRAVERLARADRLARSDFLHSTDH